MTDKEIDDTYLRKDVFNATMNEIRAMMAASEARHEKTAIQMREDFNKTIATIKEDNTRQYMQFLEAVREDMKSLKNDIMNTINFRFAFMTAFITVLFALLEYFRR